jgi:hypothetical protein
MFFVSLVRSLHSSFQSFLKLGTKHGLEKIIHYGNVTNAKSRCALLVGTRASRLLRASTKDRSLLAPVIAVMVKWLLH